MAQFRRTQATVDAAGQADIVTPASAGEVAIPETGGAPVISPEIAARVRELVEPIPGDDGDGGERIITALLSAASIDDLNAPWEGTSGQKLAGKRLEIRGVTQRKSQFEDGAGIFLVADATDTKTGDKATFTTSAVAVVLQLAVAHKLGLFPIIADVVVADKPTARGYYPYHLQVIAAGRGRAVSA